MIIFKLSRLMTEVLLKPNPNRSEIAWAPFDLQEHETHKNAVLVYREGVKNNLWNIPFPLFCQRQLLKIQIIPQSVIFVHQSIRVKIFDDKVCEFEEVESSYEEELNVTRLKTQQLHSEVFMMSSLSPCKQNFIISLLIVNRH